MIQQQMRKVSMPYTGLFNFYAIEVKVFPLEFSGINALYGPFLISTVQWRIRREIGFSCQCPIRAFFNFYKETKMKLLLNENGVNALYGPFLISTKKKKYATSMLEKVSMPYTGLF